MENELANNEGQRSCATTPNYESEVETSSQQSNRMQMSQDEMDQLFEVDP
jgi:hypothetical protein